LTFQDQPSSDLPASALEVVDFNELLGVFQGQGSPQRQQAGRGFAPQPQPPRSPQGLPGVFHSSNFPVRFY